MVIIITAIWRVIFMILSDPLIGLTPSFRDSLKSWGNVWPWSHMLLNPEKVLIKLRVKFSFMTTLWASSTYLNFEVKQLELLICLPAVKPLTFPKLSLQMHFVISISGSVTFKVSKSALCNHFSPRASCPKISATKISKMQFWLSCSQIRCRQGLQKCPIYQLPPLPASWAVMRFGDSQFTHV